MKTEFEMLKEAYNSAPKSVKYIALTMWFKDLPLDVYKWSKVAQLNIKQYIN